MKKFITKIIIFILPLSLIFLPSYIIFKKSGEDLSDLHQIIMENKPCLVGYSYCHIDRYLKVKTVSSRDPFHTWAVGSSRVMQFRSEFFEKPFYNLGISSIALDEIQPLLNYIPKEKYPKLIILGLDHWWFRLPNSKTKKKVFSYDTEPKLNFNINILKSITFHYLWKKQAMEEIFFKNQKIRKTGLTAFTFNSGFRNDGSYCYKNQINKLLNNVNDSIDTLFKESISAIDLEINNNQSPFLVDEQDFLSLDSLIRFCLENKINVIGILPPLPDVINEKMNTSNIYEYRSLMQEKIQKIFIKYNQEFFDFTELKSCNSNDKEMIDGTHGSEAVYAKILLKIREYPSNFLQNVDVNKISKLLHTSNNRFEIIND